MPFTLMAAPDGCDWITRLPLPFAVSTGAGGEVVFGGGAALAAAAVFPGGGAGVAVAAVFAGGATGAGDAAGTSLGGGVATSATSSERSGRERLNITWR